MHHGLSMIQILSGEHQNITFIQTLQISLTNHATQLTVISINL